VRVRRVTLGLLVSGSILLGIVAFLVGRELWWARHAAPSPTIDYRAQLSKLLNQQARCETNGWEHVERAAEACAKISEQIAEGAFEEQEAGLISGVYPTDFQEILRGDPDRPGVRSILRVMNALEESGLGRELAVAAAAPCLRMPLISDPTSSVRSDTAVANLVLIGDSHARPLVLNRLAWMRLAARSGDAARTAEMFEQAIKIACVQATRGLLIHHLLSNALIAAALAEVRYELVGREMPIEAIDRIQAVLRTQSIPKASVALRGEQLYMLDWLQRIYTDDGNGDGRLIRTEAAASLGSDPLNPSDPLESAPDPSRVSLHWTANLRWRALPSRKQAVDEINRMFDSLCMDAARSPRERAFDAAAFRSTLHPRSSLLSPSLGADSLNHVQRALSTADGLRAAWEATRLMLALESYRVAKGRYPTRLDDLAPSFLRELPTDPFAPDGKFWYRLNDAAGEGVAAYVLWSAAAGGNEGEASNENCVGQGTFPIGSATHAFVFTVPRAQAAE